VATAQNGLDGLEVLDEFEPDFVLVDYNMPVMDGLEMVELMRKHPRFHRTPALFLTGNQERDLPKQAYEIRGKPVSSQADRAGTPAAVDRAFYPGTGSQATSGRRQPPAAAPRAEIPREARARSLRPCPKAESGERAKLRPREGPGSAPRPAACERVRDAGRGRAGADRRSRAGVGRALKASG
jgi:CheY-like chemotaxis protein